jgi:hypothetical protein
MTRRPAVTLESQMVQPHSGPNREQVVDTMIELTVLGKMVDAFVSNRMRRAAAEAAQVPARRFPDTRSQSLNPQ